MGKESACGGKQNCATGKKAGKGAEPEATTEYGAVTTSAPSFPQWDQSIFRGLCPKPWQGAEPYQGLAAASHFQGNL